MENSTCPFDPLHQIRPRRLQAHVLSCEKKYPRHGWTRCIFDATHIIKFEDKEEHLLSCESVSDKVAHDVLLQVLNGRKLDLTKFNNTCGFNEEQCLKVINWLNMRNQDECESSVANPVKNGAYISPKYNQHNASKAGSRKSDKPTRYSMDNIHCTPRRQASHFNEKRKRYQSSINPEDSISNVGSKGDVGDLTAVENEHPEEESNSTIVSELVSLALDEKSVISGWIQDGLNSLDVPEVTSSSVSMVSDYLPSSVVSSTYNQSVLSDVNSNISGCDSFATALSSAASARMLWVKKRVEARLPSRTSNSKDKPGMTSVGVQTQGLCCCGSSQRNFLS